MLLDSVFASIFVGPAPSLYLSLSLYAYHVISITHCPHYSSRTKPSSASLVSKKSIGDSGRRTSLSQTTSPVRILRQARGPRTRSPTATAVCVLSLFLLPPPSRFGWCLDTHYVRYLFAFALNRRFVPVALSSPVFSDVRSRLWRVRGASRTRLRDVSPAPHYRRSMLRGGCGCRCVCFFALSLGRSLSAPLLPLHFSPLLLLFSSVCSSQSFVLVPLLRPVTLPSQFSSGARRRHHRPSCVPGRSRVRGRVVSRLFL